MTVADIDFAYQCTSLEGWAAETKETFAAFLAFNPAGCFVAQKNDKRIGICIATKYRNSGFIGDLVITREMRGHGYGRQLFDHAVRYLQEQGITSISLDADEPAVALYENFGFRKITRSLRFTGKVRGRKNRFIHQVKPADLKHICESDTILFGEDRGFFLNRRYQKFPDYFYAFKENDHILGYISGCPGNDIIAVGPLVLFSEKADPSFLLKGLAAATGDVALRCGVLENNQQAVSFFRAVTDLEEKTFCWRMVQGESDIVGFNDKIYAIGSAAKG